MTCGDERGIAVRDAGAVAGRKVLVVVANRSLRLAVSTRLALLGAEVASVPSLEEALDRLRAFPPDVVVAELGARASALADGIAECLGRPVRGIAPGDALVM